MFGVPYPTHGFFTAFQWPKVDRKRLYMYKKEFFGGGRWGGVRPRPSIIDTSVDEDIECHSWYQIRK